MLDRLPDLDGGLLPTLDALLVDRNVTHAAARLGITQPALSARLKRLRGMFADPLFIPAASGRGMVPTPHALAIGGTRKAPGAAERLRQRGTCF